MVTQALNAAVWVFRFTVIGTASGSRQSSLTGGLISGVHYTQSDEVPSFSPLKNFRRSSLVTFQREK